MLRRTLRSHCLVTTELSQRDETLAPCRHSDASNGGRPTSATECRESKVLAATVASSEHVRGGTPAGAVPHTRAGLRHSADRNQVFMEFFPGPPSETGDRVLDARIGWIDRCGRSIASSRRPVRSCIR